MKSLRFIVGMLCAVLLLAGCNSKESQEQLFTRLSTGVVVVLNRYYYQIELPNGNKLYFTGFDEEGDLANLTADVEEIQPEIITGTGFFIDNQGTIMTNRHVAQPIINPSEVRKNLMATLRTIKKACDVRMAELSEAYNALEQQKGNCYTYSFYGGTMIDYQRLAEIQSQQEELRNAYAEMQQAKDNVDDNLDPSSMPITPVCELGIAYNDTYVTNEKDFLERNPCVVTKVSDKDDVDLAVLQLKDKKTPEKAHVFALKGRQVGKRSFWQHLTSVFSDDGEQKLEMGQQLYMIGYNAGLILGTTKQGLKAQMTSGKVTQLPDGQRLLYSIPTLQGSSGSPVVDEYGNLVAVNFAKLGTTDNFNFGIPEDQIRQFMGW